MSIKYIIGRQGSGKSKLCVDEISKELNTAGNNNSLILIVPEQYSLQAEKDLVAATSGSGSFRAQVLSFNRLAFRVFSNTGGVNRKNLGDIGKKMLLKKIILENEKNLQYYSNAVNKNGFLDNISEIITEFYQYSVPVDKLDKNDFDNLTLKYKIHDIAIIYKQFYDFVKNSYISTDEALDILSEKIGISDFVIDSKIWVDGFYGFTPQELNVLKSLSIYSKSLSITLSMPPEAHLSETIYVNDPFYEIKSTYNKLNNTLKAVNAEFTESVLLAKNMRHSSNSLIYLEKEFFSYSNKTFDGKVKDINIYEANNVYEEIRGVSKVIKKLVIDGNYRYKDIALLNCHMPYYNNIIMLVFDEFEIPYFIDSKKTVFENVIIEFIRSLLDIVVTNWSYESVFRLLKTGLTPLTVNEIDLIENYVLAYGVKGYKWFAKEWLWGFNTNLNEEVAVNSSAFYNKEEIEKTRKDIIQFLSPFTDVINKRSQYTVKHICTKLFETILNLDIPNKIFEDSSYLNAVEFNAGSTGIIDNKQITSNYINDKRENIQVYNIVIEILDKTVEILGEEKVTIGTFSGLYEAAICECQLGIIPEGIDRVTIGDIKRTRLPEIKALFITGMNDIYIPSQINNEGLISDAEKSYLSKKGFELPSYGISKIREEQFLIYCMITKPSKYIHLSYSLSSLEGGAIRPSIFIRKIMKMFPSLNVYKSKSAKKENNYKNIIYSKKQVYADICKESGNYSQSGAFNNEFLKDVFSFYNNNNNDNNNENVVNLIRNIYYSSVKNTINESTIEKHFRKNIFGSVSQIEKYINCPFSYFASYKLKARERMIFRFSAPDMGILFHSVLNGIYEKISKSGVLLKDLSEIEVNKISDEIIDSILPQFNIFQDSFQYRYLANRIKRITRRSLWALLIHSKREQFEYYVSEAEFSNNPNALLPPVVIDINNGEHKLIMTGRIDRIDILDKDNKRYVKVIDYKFGNKKFSISDIYYGIQIQLLVYLEAFLRNNNNCLPGGMFYFRISDPLIKADKILDDSEIESLILKKLKLSGLVLNDIDIIKSFDKEILSGDSSVIPVKILKSGEISETSSVSSVNEFQLLRKHLIDILTNASESIVSGDITAKPYKTKKTSACDYCIYKSICGFDATLPEYGYNTLQELKDDDVWERLKSDERT